MHIKKRISGIVVAILLMTINLYIVAENEKVGLLVINEIMYNPEGNEDDYEWIEIYNPNKEVSIEGWKIEGTIGGVTILNGSIGAEEYIIIAKNVTAFQQRYNVSCRVLKGNWGYLANGGDWINLTDDEGNLIYSIYYPGGYTENYSAERKATGEWMQSLLEGGTPGEKNSINVNTLVYIFPQITIAEKNETFAVNITVEPAEGVAGVQCELSFNASVLEAINATYGDFFDGYNIFTLNPVIDNANGTIRNFAAAIIEPGKNVSDKGTFATIIFRAINNGFSFLNLSNVIVGNTNASELPVDVVNGSVVIPEIVEKIFITSLPSGWSLFGLPYNETISLASLIVKYNNTYYTWNEAVTNGYVLQYVYTVNRTTGMYEVVNQLKPSYGYWIYCYESIELYVNESFENGDYIDASTGWNLVALPCNNNVSLNNLTIVHDGNAYTWNEAVTNGYVLQYVYTIDRNTGSYTTINELVPGYGYWLYCYEDVEVLI